MKIIRVSLVIAAAGLSLFAFAQTPPDDATNAAIKSTALDYIDGWYTGDAERMERALSPDLAKRIVLTDPRNKRSMLQQMSALGLVQGVKRGGGKATPVDKRQEDVTILDVFQDSASVKIDAGPGSTISIWRSSTASG